MVYLLRKRHGNVTVVDRDVRAAFCGGKAALVFLQERQKLF